MTERQYYRNTTTGERGWIVVRDGKQYMQLNRAREEILLPYRPTEWVPERDMRPLNRQQVAQVAFEADKKLCLFLGLHREAKRQWLSMTDEDRIEWVKNGPTWKDDDRPSAQAMRHALYTATIKEMKPWTTE